MTKEKKQEVPQEEPQEKAAVENTEEMNEPQKEAEEPKEAPEQKDPRDERIEELENSRMRLQADYDNYRRRTREEMAGLKDYVTVDVVARFLKVLDNFERAEASMEKTTDYETVKAGLEKIRRQFEQTLKDLQVEEIPALHEHFDPNLHEAVMRGENPELPEESIEMVLEKGYRIGERVVRHSKVKVVNS